MKRFLWILSIVAILLCLFSCGDVDSSTVPTTPTGSSGGETSIPYQSQLFSGKFSKYDLEDDCAVFNADIHFADSSVRVTGNGVSVSGNVVTITTAGCYKVSGSTNDGQIIINAGDLDKVHLVFDNLSICSQSSAPLWVQNADKVCVTLKAGTVNTLSDGTSMPEGEDLPNACIYAKDSITFNGQGKMIVNAGIHNAVNCSNDLKFISGVYEINAAYNGIKGKDSVAILNANMKIVAGKDAVKSDETLDATKAFVYIAGGYFEIQATDDGIQANTAIDLQGGSFTFNCGGKTINSKGTYNIGKDVVLN